MYGYGYGVRMVLWILMLKHLGTTTCHQLLDCSICRLAETLKTSHPSFHFGDIISKLYNQHIAFYFSLHQTLYHSCIHIYAYTYMHIHEAELHLLHTCIKTWHLYLAFHAQSWYPFQMFVDTQGLCQPIHYHQLWGQYCNSISPFLIASFTLWYRSPTCLVLAFILLDVAKPQQ